MTIRLRLSALPLCALCALVFQVLASAAPPASLAAIASSARSSVGSATSHRGHSGPRTHDAATPIMTATVTPSSTLTVTAAAATVVSPTLTPSVSATAVVSPISAVATSAPTELATTSETANTANPTSTISATTPTTAPAPGATVPLVPGAVVSASPVPAAASSSRLLSAPLAFERNLGQTDGSVSYLARGRGYMLWLSGTDATLATFQASSRHGWVRHQFNPAAGTALRGDVIKLHYTGADAAATAVGEEPLPGAANYVTGRDPRSWITNVPTYGQAVYHNLYPGIDLVYYGHQGQLETDFRLSAGADPGAIGFSVEGAQGLRVDGAGNLLITTAGGTLVEHAPLAYQMIDGRRQAVPVGYVLTGDQSVSFSLGAHNTQEPLVIDPVLSYATYLGGSSTDNGTEQMAVDGAGEAFITGWTTSADFPTTTGAYSTTFAGNIDAFVSKLNASGTALLYSTYLGGTQVDEADAVVVDGAGDAFVSGETESTDFPTTTGAYSTTYGGGHTDAFVVKLNPAGSRLLYSTYLGGSGGDYGYGLAIDSGGDAYLTGYTTSQDFPTTSGAFRRTPPGGSTDSYVAKLNASGSSLVYSTYLGGSGDDGASSIAVDGTGNAYVTLRTASSDFPTTTGAYSTTYGGGAFDVAVSKLNASSSALVYSTFVGGNGLDQPQGLALDSGGNAYVAGFTTSPNFPLAKPIQGTYTDNGPYGQGDGFVFKLNASGNALTYSTYLGGSGDTNGYGIAVDSAGEAYVTGETDSTDFPTANAFQLNDADPSNCASIQTCGDAFLSKFTAAGTALAYSTYLGGYGEDEGGSVALDGAGNAYIMGYTNSTNFPTVNAPQPADAGSYDAFAVKVVAASSGAIPWRPHHTVRLSDGLSASVDLADGHVDVTAAGLRVPARGPDLALDQVWDSALAQAGVTSTLGQGWVSSLTPRMSGILTGTVRYQAADGAIWPFQYTGPLTATGLYTYTTPPGLPWQLTASTSGYTLTNILTSETLSFDALGRLVSDADAYNNQNTLSYTGTAPLPVIVANSGGQGNGTNRALHLGYNGAGQLTYAQSPLAYASANQQGQLVGYAYNGAGELSVLIRGYGTSDAVTETFGYSGTQLTTITTGAGHVWALSYDTQGRVVGITSPASGTVGQAGYTPSYSTIFVYNPSQTTVAEGYNTPGQLLTTYTLDSQGEAIAVTDGLNDTSYTTYDADHDVLTSTDANNHTTRNYLEYVGPNGSTGLITETDRPAISPLFQGNTLAPVTTTYKYDTANNLIEQDTSYGSVTGYTYDSHHGQLSRVEYVSPVSSCSLKDRGGSAGRHPDNGCSTTYEWRGQINAYDTYGELVARTDGRGVSVAATNAPSPPPTPTLGACPNRCAASYTQSYTYTVQGDLASESTPPIVTTLNGSTVTAPVTTSYGYDGDGNQISQTSANGKTTTYSYDHLGRQTQVSNPSVQIYTGSTITPTETTQYDKDGNVAQEVDGNGDVSQSSYDPLDRLVAATNAISGTTIYTYSATEKTAQQDPQGNVTTYGYDAAGRLLSTTDPAHDVTQYQYDPVGNTVTITTGDGTTATSIDTRQYDALDEIVTDTVSGPGSPTQRTVTSYDQNGNVVQVQQPDGDVVFNSYDFANQLIASEIDAGPVTGQTNNLQELFSYDDAGNVVSRQDFDNRSAVTTYDGDNRVAQTVDTDLTSGTVITTTSGYDPDGNTISQQTQTALAGGAVQTHSETDAYNAADWLTGTTVDGTTTSYDYDGAGQERSQTVNNNANHVRSTLNPEGLTTQIVEAVGGSTTYTDTFGYNADDLPLTQSVPGPVTEQVSYDMASRPITVTWSGPAGVSAPLASSYSYGYNAASWTTALTSTLNGNTTTQTLTHDAAGRLTAAQGPGSASQSWTYDGNGNILTHTVGSATSVYSYTTALPNELLQLRVAGQPTSYYSYDHNGDTTNITNGSTLNTSLQYDSQARLITITQADGTQVTLGYNDAGQRSSYRVSKGGSTSLAETFQYRDGLVGQAVVVTGTTTYTDTYLYTQDGAPLELVRIQSGQPVKRYWYVLDGRDNVVALTDSSGNVVDRYSYDVWGNPTSVSESVVQPFRYAGYWWDAQLGWYWVSVRYYDPSLERWVQPDPSQIEGVHTYTYVHDDPINNVDPSGMCSIGPVNLPVGRSEPCINDIVRELHGHMPYGRWPDYLVLTGAIGKIFQIGPIPLPSTFGVNVVLSRYGHWYWGVAGGLGTPGSSIFIGAGWIFQGNVPSDSYLESFITGWSISGNVVTSAHAGGTIVWGEVPDAGHWSDFGFELGAGSSTGASITASYDWPIPLLPQGPSWSH